MRGINRVTILGTLGRDPELSYTQGNSPYCRMSLATNEKWTDKSGNVVENTEWHRVTLWGKPAENAAKYLTKGSQVYIEGKLQTRKWTDQQGVERYSTDIVVSGYTGTMQFVSSGGRSGNSSSNQPPNGQPAQSVASVGQSAQQEPPMFDDDIPF